MDPEISVPKVSGGLSLQKMFMDCDSQRLEAAVKHGIDVLDRLRGPLHRLSSDVDGSGWLQTMEYLQKQTVQPKIIIGVVGNTGAGKSSVINAVLDEERLVPTNCMRACTAVVTEISYNYTEVPYQAEIEFITAKDWARELQILFDDLLDGKGNISREASNQETDAGIAYAKIKSVYPKYTKRQLENSTVSELIELPSVQKVLGRIESVDETNPKQFYRILQTYVDSREKITPEKDATENLPLDMEVWPLVKVVRIYVKAAALSTGATIVDLPGVHDSNPARAAVSESYIKQCTGLWIVAPITRAVDDKAAKCLLGGTFKRQLKMDGGLNSVTFICSKTDDISLLECQEWLGLEKRMSALRDKADQHSEKKHENEQYLDRLKKTMSELTAEADKIDEQIEMWDAMKEQIEDGRIVYAPIRPCSKKRKRGSNSDISRTLPKQAKAGGHATKNCPADDNMKYQLGEDQGQSSSNPLTAGEVDGSLLELRVKKKQGRYYRKDLTIEMETVMRQISDIEVVLTNVQVELNRLAISGRNEYARSAIQEDFAAGIKELDQELAEDTSPSSFNPEANARDYEEVARSLPVFCISSRAYQKLQGRMEMELTIPGFQTVTDTEVPQLQAHCKKLAEVGRDINSRCFLNGLDQLLNSLRLMSLADGSQVSDEQRTVWVNTIEANFKMLSDDLEELIRDVCERFRSTIECHIFTVYKDAVEAATNKADETVRRWGERVNHDNRAAGGFCWSTYKAICRRDGVYANAQGTHDWNAELTEPILKAVASGWESTFSRRVQSLLLSTASEGARLLQSFHDGVHHTDSQNISQIGNHVLTQQLRVYQQLFRDMCLDTLTTIKRRSREINRKFQPVIADKLKPAYAHCTVLSGPGSFNQMKEVLSCFVNQAKQTMFHESVETVQEALEELLKSLEGNMMTQVGEILNSVKRDYTSTQGGKHSTVTKCLLQLILNIVTESESYFKGLANMASEPGGTIVNTNFSRTSSHFSASSPSYSLPLASFIRKSPSLGINSATYNPTSPTIDNSSQFFRSSKYSPSSPGWSRTTPELDSTNSQTMSDFGLPYDDETSRFGLLRSLFNGPTNDEELRGIYQIGDRIICDTGFVMKDLNGWLWKDFQQYGALLPSCHNLSSAQISTSMFRFLMKTNNDRQRKSLYRRLARVIFFIFVKDYVEQLEKREINGECVDRHHRNLTAIAHKTILQEVGDLPAKVRECAQKQVSDSKSYGKRWWRLGSGIGIIAILASGMDVARYVECRSFSNGSLELLVNYVRNAYPNAIAHFQSLDDIVEPLLVKASLATDQIKYWSEIDPEHLQFNTLDEKPKWVDAQTMMDAATESLLCHFKHCI